MHAARRGSSADWKYYSDKDKDSVYELRVFRSYPRPDRKLLLENGWVEFTRAEDTQDLELPNAALLDCHSEDLVTMLN